MPVAKEWSSRSVLECEDDADENWLRTPTSQPYDLTFRESSQCHEGPEARVGRVVARMRRAKSNRHGP
jgi:hypothetical protein